MKIGAIAFTDQGLSLGGRLKSGLQGHAVTLTDGREKRLKDWTEESFRQCGGLVFIGAAGIAVRAIAPLVRAKWEDPAVVVVDELGRFAIPILSGHIGGANRLAGEIAQTIGATPVITTATDSNGVFAIDQWAVSQGMAVGNPQFIKDISGRLLRGESITIFGAYSWKGTLPEGVRTGSQDGDVYLGPLVCRDRLHLIPRSCVLGIGCRRGVTLEKLEAALDQVAERVDVRAIGRISTIALKAKEPGLLQLAEKHGWPVSIYSAEELEQVPGEFTASEFVRRVAGVDNVCERSAVLCAGGPLVLGKLARDGVTMAVAESPKEVSFEQ